MVPSIDNYIEVFQPEDLKIRPIISGTKIPTQRLHCPIEIAPCLTTYVKDGWDFLRFLPSSLNFDSVLCSCDIESLYTSISTDLGIKAIDYSMGTSSPICHQFSIENPRGKFVKISPIFRGESTWKL